MSYTDEHGNKCSCSRNRKCAFHTAQLKKVARVAKPVQEAKKVAMGLDALREKYSPPAASPKPRPVRRQSQWVKPA